MLLSSLVLGVIVIFSLLVTTAKHLHGISSALKKYGKYYFPHYLEYNLKYHKIAVIIFQFN